MLQIPRLLCWCFISSVCCCRFIVNCVMQLGTWYMVHYPKFFPLQLIQDNKSLLMEKGVCLSKERIQGYSGHASHYKLTTPLHLIVGKETICRDDWFLTRFLSLSSQVSGTHPILVALQQLSTACTSNVIF